MSKLELSVLASLKRATGLYPGWPFVQWLPGKLPGDQCHVAWTRLQLECAIHNHLRKNDDYILDNARDRQKLSADSNYRCDNRFAYAPLGWFRVRPDRLLTYIRAMARAEPDIRAGINRNQTPSAAVAVAFSSESPPRI